MKKAFTLVELLVVVVVIVTLMTITFRLAGSGGEATARNMTINRMQRLENCLSGYYAAYGSYPPVQLHGSRDYTFAVDGHGIQKVGSSQGKIQKVKNGANSGGGQHEDKLDWKRVEAACRSQPVGMSYPCKNEGIRDYVDKVSKMLMERAMSNDSKYKAFRDNEALKYGFQAITDNSFINSKRDKQDWSEVQVFKYGLLSYLLPRYIVMLGGDDNMNQIYNNQMSWKGNNQIPCRLEDGVQYPDWGEFNREVRQYKWKVAVLPSQAICARWLPNLEGSVSALAGSVEDIKKCYGVDIRDSYFGGNGGLSIDNPNPTLYSADDSQSGGDHYSNQYWLDGMTMVDGWGNEFYYYSPPPHQGYTIWSAGPNGKTFPPWVTDEELKSLKSDELQTVQGWIADDLTKLSN